MVLSRGLVISLGVSALGCTLLFLYFRNKITAVEKKVDIMFDLIQNHQSQQQQMNMQEAVHMNSRQEVEESDDNESQQVTGVWSDNVKSDPELIQVSEDEEEDDDDDDSEEVSDTEDEEDEEDEEEETPKLSLAKTEDMTLEVNDVKKIVVQESKPETINTELEEPEDVTDSLDEIEVDEDDEEEEEDEDEDVEKEEISIQKLDDEFDYNKLKVSELKAIAKQKGLEGYKSLKKGPLVELLKSSE